MKIHSYLIILLLLASCNNGNNGNINKEVTDSNKVIIDISETIDAPVQLIDEYIDFIKIIPLETTESSAVTDDIWSVKVGKQNIFIKDNYSKGDVAIFDLEGRFVKRLPFGQGPGEIIGALRIKYDGVSNHLYVLDAQSKIIKYDESGNYLNEYQATRFIVDFIPTPEGFLQIQGPRQNSDNEYYMFLDDTLARNIMTWSLGAGLKNGSMPDNMYQIGEDFRFKKNAEPIIYSYHDKQIKVKYEIKYDNPPIDYSKFTYVSDIEEQYPEAYLPQNSIVETKNWLRMELISESKEFKNIFVNKKNYKSWSQDRILWPDHFISWMTLIGADAENDIFVGVVKPVEILKVKHKEYGWDGSNPNNLISPEDMEKLKKVQPDDNPIIVLFKLKDEI